MAKKLFAECVVSIPRAGEFTVKIPVLPHEFKGEPTPAQLNNYVAYEVKQRIKVRITNGKTLGDRVRKAVSPAK